MKRIPKSVLVVGIVAVLVTVTICGNIWRTRAAKADAVWVAEAVSHRIEEAIFSTGEVEASKLVEVRAGMTGILEQVSVEAGDAVTCDECLANYRLQDLLDRESEAESILASRKASLSSLRTRADQGAEEARLEVVLAEVALVEAKEAYEESRRWPPWDDRRIDATRRWQEAEAHYDLARINAERSMVSAEELEAAEAAYKAAEVSLKQVREDLKKVDVVSPASGVVLAVHVSAGQQVSAGQLLLEVSDPFRVKVKAKVDEMEIAQVKVGNPARVSTQAYEGVSFDGEITRISPTAEREGNVATFLVDIDMDNQEGLLKPGMSVDIDIILESIEALVAIPLEAVRDTDTGKKVLVVADGAIEEREVEVGASNDSRVEIMRGLQRGEVVVTGPVSSLKTLKTGMRVEVSEEGRP